MKTRHASGSIRLVKTQRLSGLAAVFFAVGVGFVTPVLATNDGHWVGMDHPRPDSDYTTTAGFMADLNTLGMNIAREGLTHNNLVYDDALVATYNANGISPHNVIDWHKTNSTHYTTTEYYARCLDIMSRYDGNHGHGLINYYIVGNEPDLDNKAPHAVTSTQMVAYITQAYNASRVADPAGGIKIESSPTSSPETTFLRDMINLNVGDVCDYIGVHAYSSQINDGRLSKPWEYQQLHGGTMKPATCSECGVSTSWAPGGWTFAQQNQWQADFGDQAYVQFKQTVPEGYGRRFMRGGR